MLDRGLTDIASKGINAGIRAGELVARAMVAVRIGPDLRSAVWARPPYLATRPKPRTPQDLTAQSCINLRLPARGGLYAWEFKRRGRDMRIEGQLVFNGSAPMLEAAPAGLSLAYLPEDLAAHVAEGRLVRVLGAWCPPYAGYHLHDPRGGSLRPLSRSSWSGCDFGDDRVRTE